MVVERATLSREGLLLKVREARIEKAVEQLGIFRRFHSRVGGILVILHGATAAYPKGR